MVVPLMPVVASACIPHRSEEHTSEVQSLQHLVCRLLLGKKSLFRSDSKSSDASQRFHNLTTTSRKCHDVLPLHAPLVHQLSMFRSYKESYVFFFKDAPPSETSSIPFHVALPI